MKIKFRLTKPLFWVLAFMITFICVITTVEASSSGAQVAKFEVEESQLIEKGRQLSSELVKQSALSALQDLASQEGFTRPQTTLYLLDESPVAARLPLP